MTSPTDLTGTRVIVFDVNETLSDLTPMADRFEDVGLPRAAAATWFAAVLRDGFALSSVGAAQPFADVAAGVLRSVLAEQSSTVAVDEAVRQVMDGFLALDVHPDVVEGVRALRAAGLRLITLSNGSPGVAEQLLTRAGVRAEFEDVLSVQDAPAWKPDPRAYELAVRRLGLPAQELMLVAVHPWDIDGAHRAGLRTAWLNRKGVPYPAVFSAPEVTVSALPELAAVCAPDR